MNQAGNNANAPQLPKGAIVATQGNLIALQSGHFVHLVDKQSTGGFTSATKKQTLAGHTAPLRSVAFSPNGVILASGSDDNTVILWDAVSGQKKHTLTDQKGPVRSVTFSPDGATVASGSKDKAVILWDAVSGQKKQTLTGHTDGVWSVAFSPEGRTIATGSSDKTVILWDAASGQKKHTLTDHKGSVHSVAFSPDGVTVASGGKDRVVMLWDATSGQKKQTLTGHTDTVWSVAFSPDGATIASGSDDGKLILWDAASGQKKHTLAGHTDSVWCTAFSPDGATIASGGPDKSLMLWDSLTGQMQQKVANAHTDAVRYIAFSPNGTRLASGSFDQTVILWDTAWGKEIAVHGPFTGVASVAFEPCGVLLVRDTANVAHRIFVSTLVAELEAKIQVLQSNLSTQAQLLSQQNQDLSAKDTKIVTLTAEVADLQVKLSASAPLPVWDLRTPFLWNEALFAGTQKGRFSVLPSDPRLSNVQQFFKDLMATRGRYSATFQDNPVAGFRLDRVELWRDTTQQTLISTMEHKANTIRDGTPLPEIEKLVAEAGADAEKRAFLNELKALFFTQGVKKKCNLLHVFHGTRVELVDEILTKGLLPLTREDDGYFGHGCYTTPSIEYAAKYATGDLCKGGRRAPDAAGCWPVIMFAALVGIAYPVTRDADYATPANKASKSKFFGTPLKLGVVDTHVVGVSAANGFQASDSAASTDYLELVSKDSHLLPLAVLWVKK